MSDTKQTDVFKEYIDRGGTKLGWTVSLDNNWGYALLRWHSIKDVGG